jgi:hypothetical protein
MPSASEISEILEKLSVLKKKTPEDSINNAPSEAPADSVPEPGILSDIDSLWNQIKEKVHSDKPTLANLLDETTLEKYESGELYIKINGTDPFHKSMIEKNGPFLESVISDLVQESVQIHVNQDATVFPDKKKKDDRNDRKKRLDKIKSDHPNIAKLVDDLDLEII